MYYYSTYTMRMLMDFWRNKQGCRNLMSACNGGWQHKSFALLDGLLVLTLLVFTVGWITTIGKCVLLLSI